MPQVIITAVFFFYPAGQAVWQSLFIPDPFGLKSQFVGLGNFEYLFGDPYYRASFVTTAVFSGLVTVVSMGMALYLALLADRLIKGAGTYRTLLIWPYAVAPAAIAGAVLFMFTIRCWGLFFFISDCLAYLEPGAETRTEAMGLGRRQPSSWVADSAITSVSSLRAVIEAAAIDGARFWTRFRTIVWPLLSPTTFFLLVVNIVYAFFETFGVIHTITSGGPQQATTILVYKVYADGFVGQDLGSSAAQSVVLLVVVGLLTIIQFKFIERRVHY
ncbi:UNVERIFIED_CONTAM: hypothetical protein GTU68_005102 [Idotea baltica]|nr:hypothetical protein [Idotea baltica]